MSKRTMAQRERQSDEYRERGRYAKVNPCYVCERSAGVLYFSGPGTDLTIADALLVICARCAKAMPETGDAAEDGFEALRVARAIRAKLGLPEVWAFSEESVAKRRKEWADWRARIEEAQS